MNPNDEQQTWTDFPVKLCTTCNKYYEVVKKSGGRSELYLYKDHYYGVEEEECPICLGEENYNIITDSTVRMALPGQNQKSRGKSRFIGVRYLGNDKIKQLPEGAKRRKEIRKLWRSDITIDKVRRSIGIFYSEIGAAKAYNKEAVKLGRPLNLIN